MSYIFLLIRLHFDDVFLEHKNYFNFEFEFEN